jgi:spermidine synthase
MRHILVSFGYLVIFLTGAAGLVYQVTWQKYLSRLLGADSIATSIILATFLGGLSLGYYLCGKFSTRLKEPLRGFAVLEGAIGIWALAFPLLFAAVDALTRSWSFEAPVFILFQGILCSALLIGVPTICMGGTVPLLTRGISRSLKESTNVHAAIYSVNTAGAVLGALLAGFFLVPRFGLPVTLRGTAAVNLGACLFFLFLARRVKPQPAEGVTSTTAGHTPEGSLRFPAPILYAVALASGFYVMMLENVLIRVTNFAIGSSSYSFSLVVAVFILSIAVGSYIVSRLSRLPASLLFWNQFLIAILLLAVYYSLDTWPYWAHLIRIGFQPNTVGFWQYYIAVFVALTGILILPVACMGATIPLAFHELKRDLHQVGRHSGLLLSWNTVGSLAGSIIGGMVLYYALNNERVFLLAVLLAAGTVCLVARYLPGSSYLVSGGALTALAAGMMVFAPLYNQDRFSIGTFRSRAPFPFSLAGPTKFFEGFLSGSKLLSYEDDPISAVGVVEFDAQPPLTKNPRSIMVNGKSDSSTGLDIYTLKLSAHLPALMARERKDVLIIGLGTGVTAGEIALYPDVEHVDVAEISRGVVKALPCFTASTHAVHENPKLRILKGDAFRILGRSEKKWDIIISEPTNPWVTGVDLLFTEEFYRMAKSHLTDGGVLIQWVQQYDSSEEMLGMVFSTVQREFPECRLFWSSSADLIMVATKQALTGVEIRRAEAVLQRSDEVRESLRTLDLDSLDSLLIREIWTPSYFRTMFGSFERQTMDMPRLHYLAGRAFFNGFNMAPETLWSPASVPFVPEYLIAMKYPDWKTHAFSKEAFQILLRSLQDRTDNSMPPVTPAVGLKTFLANPQMFPMSYQQSKQLGLDVLQFVVNPNQAKLDWSVVGLDGATFRKKAQFLLSHILKTRNWIVPYSTAGLEALLRQGMSESKDPYERTWCALELALQLGQEKRDQRLVQAILDQALRENNGKLSVAEPDRPLLERVRSMIAKLQ